MIEGTTGAGNLLDSSNFRDLYIKVTNAQSSIQGLPVD
jgi:hypothetical protein